MTWVKVCGVTDMRAVTAAVDGGVDAIGFNLVIGSPRYIDPERATALMRDLPVLRFVVTADLDPADAFGLLEVTGADGIQNHGIGASAVAAEAIDAGYLALRPIPVTGVGEVPIGDLPSAVMPLFDTAHPDMHGGTGTVFDWSAVADVGRPFVLAGGLSPDNVERAIDIARPFGVDASSGLESSPGVKDPVRIVDFIERAKRT